MTKDPRYFWESFANTQCTGKAGSRKLRAQVFCEGRGQEGKETRDQQTNKQGNKRRLKIKQKRGEPTIKRRRRNKETKYAVYFH
jgi:hypothetical protein